MRTTTLALTSGAALAAILPQAASARAAGCPLPAKPVVTQITSSSASFASTAAPTGAQVVGRFRLGRVLTYPVLLGGGPWRVGWRMTVSSLQPGRRYTVVAQVVGRGCRAESATSFRTPNEAPGSPVPGAPAPASAVEDGTATTTPYDSWDW